MIKWKYIATKLADEYSYPGNGAIYNDSYLFRRWDSLFDYRPEMDHHNPQTMSGNYALFYNFIMTIGNRSGLEDNKKVERVITLVSEITEYFDYEKIQKIFRKGGYELEPQNVEFKHLLSQHGSFHREIVKHCDLLFKDGHYMLCVNEATKAYNKAVKEMSNDSRDGQALMLWAFSENGPLKINSYKTESEKNEQDGIKFLSAGLISGFRNPTSHETSSSWIVNKEDCIKILGIASFLFEKLDSAVVTNKS